MFESVTYWILPRATWLRGQAYIQQTQEINKRDKKQILYALHFTSVYRITSKEGAHVIVSTVRLDLFTEEKNRMAFRIKAMGDEK